MSSTTDTVRGISRIERELYFLIGRFLSNGPCKKATKVLLDELRDNQLLPMRIDWEGDEHYRSYDSLVTVYRHIHADHLLKICQRIGPLLDKDIKPSVAGVGSLLGAGRQSMLRTIQDVQHIHWRPDMHVATHHQRPLQPPANLARPPHLVHILSARELTGLHHKDHVKSTRMYSHINRLSRSLGHLSAVYCLCFDNSGQYFFTGADDHLIKIWSTYSGRLLGTLRGHSAEISDMAVNNENTVLASGSCDKFVRVWCLKSLAPVAVLHGHSGSVTSLQFSSYQRGNTRFLASTGSDGCVCFWKWQVNCNKFDPKPIKFIEKSRAGAQMLCSSFSPGGLFLTTGNSDQVIRVYSLAGPLIEKICELEAHVDRVDSIAYSSHSSRFITGSKDGVARIWRFERQEWRNIMLPVSKTLDSAPNDMADDDFCAQKLRVTMVTWNCDDTRVITAVSNCTLKVWDPMTGNLLRILSAHTDEVFVLECNPIDRRILLSAGHDGNILIWDMETGQMIKKYFNTIQGQGHGAVFDCKWAPDGQSFASTDSHGFIMYFGFGSDEIYKRLPEDMFFHTDYRPLIRDANDYVLDEQTQQPPHLMPPPFLVDIDGNPHPPFYQRLVPGREACADVQLIPQMGVLPNGDREVLDDILQVVQQPPVVEVPPPVEENDVADEDRIIDRMIEHLQAQQDQRLVQAGQRPLSVSISDHGEGLDDLHSPRSVGPLSPPVRARRRTGGDEGIRQVSGNVPVSRRATIIDLDNWKRRVIIRDLDPAIRKTTSKKLHQLAEDELRKFISERKKKPLPQSGDSSDSSQYMRTRHRKRHRLGYSIRSGINEETTVNRLATRALYDTEEEAEDTPGGTTEEVDDVEDVAPPDQESDHLWKSSSDGESTDYSDWTADTGMNLQPPKRRSARRTRRPQTWSSDSDEEDRSDAEDSDESRPCSSRRQPAPKRQQPAKKKPLRQIKREKRRQQKKEKLLNEQKGITELPDAFKIPEWLSESVPHKSPYFPQMGDEVVYFKQGHELYLKAVKLRNAYEVDTSRNKPWHKIQGLKEMEIVKVIGLKYEVRPPRLVCLKLSLIDPTSGKSTGGRFSIKYHDMPDVIDFIILKETYDIAIERQWKVGDRFRSLIDDAWWMGVIQSQVPLDPQYPDSVFQSITVHWDNGEIEKMSPWDLEPFKENRLPRMKGGSVPVTDQELRELMFRSKPSDWLTGGQDYQCDRIGQALDKVMELSIAEHFLAPVDLNAFPLYGMIIAYPVDLSLIKERLEKRFYRRFNAVQFDVRHIESNAVAFNEPKSRIVKLAKQVTELLLRVICDPDCFDPMPIYNQIIKDADFAIGSDKNGHSSQSGGEPSSSRSTRTRSLEINLSRASWKAQCRQLLDIIFDCEDSKPFRVPVDANIFPEYHSVIDQPIDLGTIKEHLNSNGYDNPHEFSQDVRLVFKNSKTFNTNKRSKIYAMTLRLSAMFEEHIKEIMAAWKAGSKGRRSSKRRPSPRKLVQSPASNHSISPRSNHTTPPGSTHSYRSNKFHSSGSSGHSRGKGVTRRTERKVIVRPIIDSEEEEEEEPEKPDEQTDDDSDSDFEIKTKSKPRPSRSKPSQKVKPAPKTKYSSKDASKEKELQNGYSSRYSTRVATGTVRRKNYNHMHSDASDHSENANGSASSDYSDTEIKRPLSKGISSRPDLLPKGASRRRQRVQSDDSDSDEANLEPKAKHRKVVIKSSDDEVVEELPKKHVSRTRGLGRTDVKNGHDEDENDNDDEQDDDDENNDKESEENSESEKSDETEMEESSEVEAPARKTRRSARQVSKPERCSVKKYSFDDDVSEVVIKKSKRYGTRNRGQRTVQYHEDSEDNSGDEGVTSVSSRGRVRRIPVRARPIFS